MLKFKATLSDGSFYHFVAETWDAAYAHIENYCAQYRIGLSYLARIGKEFPMF